MRPSTGYKLVGGALIAAAVITVVLLWFGVDVHEIPRSPPAFIGFLLYVRGMSLAAKEGPQPPSIHLAVARAWLAQLARRVRGRV
jgi:hypothetical protein